MLDPTTVREDPSRVRKALADRGAEDVDLDGLLRVDERLRTYTARIERLRSERTELHRELGTYVANRETEQADAVKARSRELKADVEQFQEHARELQRDLQRRVLELPQLPHEQVPLGVDPRMNVERSRWGVDDRRSVSARPLTHDELGEALGIVDESRAAKTTGEGWQFRTGAGARLERALVRLASDVARERGYVDVVAPILAKSASLRGTGQLPRFPERAYRIEGEHTDPYEDTDQWLSPSPAVPVTTMHANETLAHTALPLQYQTPGLATRPVPDDPADTEWRSWQRQSTTLTLVEFVEPDTSDDRFDSLGETVETVLRRLTLPYRLLERCTGALDFEAARQVDVECVTPAGDTDSDPEIGGGWRSVASVTNARAFQARRSAIRYRREDDSEPYVHTLTAELALAPLFATVLEYYQNEDETVTIPDALRGHVDGQERIEGREPALADAATDR